MEENIYQCECCGEDFASRRVRKGEKLCANCVGLRRALRRYLKQGLEVEEVLSRAQWLLGKERRDLSVLPIINLDDETPFLTLSRGGEPVAIVMSPEACVSLMVTLEEAADPGFWKALRESEEDIKAGRIYSYEEVFGHPPPETGQ